MQSKIPDEITALAAQLNDELVKLVMLHCASGDYSTGLAVMARGLDIYEKQLGPDHPTTQAVRKIYEYAFDQAAKK